MRGVSVIICCYNSASRIKETLRHLSLQKTDCDLEWEVIVVDNASTDNTEQFVHEYWNGLNSKIALRIVSEPVPGLSIARTKGIKESKYNILIFCDDDNWLVSNYIQLAHTIINGNERIGALGGRGMVKCDGILPSWFDSYSGYFACTAQGDKFGNITENRGYLFGAGLILRKEALLTIGKLGLKPILSDRKGNRLTSGGDVELCFQLRLSNWELWYHPDLVFYHFMPQNRLSERYLIRLVGGINYSGIFLNPYLYAFEGTEVTRLIWFRDALKLFKNLSRATINLVFKRFDLLSRVGFSASFNAFFSILTQFLIYRSNFLAIKNASKGFSDAKN